MTQATSKLGLHQRALRIKRAFHGNDLDFKWNFQKQLWIFTDLLAGVSKAMTDAEIIAEWGSSLDALDIQDSQYRWIKKRFGKRAADNANYASWSDDVVVGTKVYGHGFLTSRMINGRVKHDFEG